MRITSDNQKYLYIKIYEDIENILFVSSGIIWTKTSDRILWVWIKKVSTQLVR